MKLKILTLAFALLSFAASAKECPILLPTDYLVFSRGDLLYTSDFNGPIGIGQSVRMHGFHVGAERGRICVAMVAGGAVELRDGMVYGGIESGAGVKLTRSPALNPILAVGRVETVNSGGVAVRTGLSSNVQRLPMTGDFYIQRSREFSQMPITATAQPGGPGLLYFDGFAPRKYVFNISNDEWLKFPVIRFRGVAGATFIINISGVHAGIGIPQSNGGFQGQDIQLEGMSLGQVLLNFYEAQDLTITASGGRVYGIPATVLAPYAATSFWNSLITGGLYVGSLCGDGQVNAGGLFLGWPGVPATPVNPAPPALRCPPSSSTCAPLPKP